MDPFVVLPWELGRECLLRVPYDSHANLKVVSKTWEAVVKHPQFYEDRKKLGTSEQLICFLEYLGETHPEPQYVFSVFDPLRGTKKTLPPLSLLTGSHDGLGLPFHSACICVSQKLILLGGRYQYSTGRPEALKTVFIFDFLSSKWSRGADMPVPSVYCACSVSPEGLIYVAGGKERVLDVDVTGAGDADRNSLQSAAVYNVFADEWKLLPDMNRGRAGCYGTFIHGNFFVIRDQYLMGSNAEVYDPKTGVWTTVENMGFMGACLVASSSGRLYSFWKQPGVMEYDSTENVWRPLDSLPKILESVYCCVAWHEKIFVYGFDERNVKVWYMYEPPPTRSAAGKKAEPIGIWTAIDRSENCCLHNKQVIVGAVPLQI